MNFRFWIACIIIAGAITGCSQEDIPAEQQLDKLRAERAELDQQIRDLEKELDGNGNQENATPVTVITTVSEPFEHIIDVKGTVDSRSSADVRITLAGQVTDLYVRNGQSVKKGDVLVQLDADVIVKQIDEVKTQLEFATTVYEKQKRIYEKKAGSEIQYLQAKNNKETLERRLASLEEQVSMATIEAPTSGIVDNVQPRVGEIVMPGMPMMTIVNNSDMRVVVDLAEPYISTVQAGDKVTILIPEIDASMEAKIGTVAKSVNAINRTFRVEIPINGANSLLKPNQTCNVRINDKTIDGAVAIPLASIVREGTDEYVYVVGDNAKVAKRKIETGIVSEGSVVVNNGIAASEMVVVKGVQNIADGQAVRIID